MKLPKYSSSRDSGKKSEHKLWENTLQTYGFLYPLQNKKSIFSYLGIKEILIASIFPNKVIHGNNLFIRWDRYLAFA